MPQNPIVMTASVQLGVAASVLYTQGANSVGQILRASVYNTEASVTRQITIYRVAAGGSPGVTNIVTSGQGGRVMAGQDMVLNALAGMSLAAGETIQGLCDSAAKVNFVMSGYDNT